MGQHSDDCSTSFLCGKCINNFMMQHVLDFFATFLGLYLEALMNKDKFASRNNRGDNMKITFKNNCLIVDGKEYPCVRFDGVSYLTVNQLASLSGYNQKTIRKKIKSGAIPCIQRENRRVLISVPDLQRLAEDGVLIKNITA